MSYRVIWREAVSRSLDVEHFLDRELGRPVNAIPAAVEEIDHALAADPHAAGESRDGGERVLIVPPVTVYFEIFDADRVVLFYRHRLRR